MGKIRATGPLSVLGICFGFLQAMTTPAWSVETTTEHFVAKASLINGNSGNVSQKYSYLALAVFRPTSFAGTVTAVTSNSIVDVNATWSQNEFNGTNGAYFIEFENGAMADVLSTDAATRSLSFPGTLPEGVNLGDTYIVRKHTTIADILGANNESGLQAGLNADQADNILLRLPETQQSYTLFYANIPGFEGWYRHDYLEADSMVVYPEQGLIIRRRESADLTVIASGVSRKSPTRVPVYSGYNLISTLRSSGSTSLASLNLFTGNSDTGIAGGNNADEADNVIINLPNQGSAIYFYLTLPGYLGWYDVSYNSADNVLIPAGTAFFINRKSQRPMFQWNIPAE